MSAPPAGLRRGPLRLALAAGGLFLLTLAALPALAPLSAPGLAARVALRGVCHQMPARCPAPFGDPAGLCHRCAGLFVGGLLACALVGRRHLSRSTAAALLGLALAGIAGEWTLEKLGWISSPAIRAGSSVLAGALGLGALLATVPPGDASRYTAPDALP